MSRSEGVGEYVSGIEGVGEYVREREREKIDEYVSGSE